MERARPWPRGPAPAQPKRSVQTPVARGLPIVRVAKAAYLQLSIRPIRSQFNSGSGTIPFSMAVHCPSNRYNGEASAKHCNALPVFKLSFSKLLLERFWPQIGAVAHHHAVTCTASGVESQIGVAAQRSNY